MSREWPQIKLRVPIRSKDWLTRIAAHERRSINSTINLIIEREIIRQEKGTGTEFGDRPDASTTTV